MKLHRDYRKMLKALGAKLRAIRCETGISLPTLCKLAGVSKGNVSKIENGTGNLTMVTLYRLCWSLGIHPREVLPRYGKSICKLDNECTCPASYNHTVMGHLPDCPEGGAS